MRHECFSAWLWFLNSDEVIVRIDVARVWLGSLDENRCAIRTRSSGLSRGRPCYWVLLGTCILSSTSGLPLKFESRFRIHDALEKSQPTYQRHDVSFRRMHLLLSQMPRLKTHKARRTLKQGAPVKFHLLSMRWGPSTPLCPYPSRPRVRSAAGAL